MPEAKSLVCSSAPGTHENAVKGLTSNVKSFES